MTWTESTDPTAHIEYVDPNTAHGWLEHNTHNRHIRPSLVNRYARDMAGGNWALTGEAVKFTTDGTLLDGQHRLRAVVRSGATVPVLVVRGVDESAQNVMDTGAARNAGDALNLNGKRHGHVLAAAARIGVLIDENRLRSNYTSVSHPELFAWIEARPDLEYAVDRAQRGDLKNHISLPVSLLAYAYYRAARVDFDAAEGFFVSLATRANLPLGSPVLTLANRLDRIQRDKQQGNRIPLLWLVFRSWNAWRDTETLSRLLLPNTVDTLPELA